MPAHSGRAAERWRRRLFLLPLLALGLYSLPAGATPPAQPEPVTIQLRWMHQFQFAGYYAALEKGFYRDEGLVVTLVEGAPGRTPVGEVLAGRALYGEANSELLYQRLRGEPLVALAAIYQHSPSVLLTRRDRDIATPRDLIGRRVMMVGGSSDVDFLAMLRKIDIDADQLRIIPSSYDIRDLLSGETDAFNAYLTNEPFYLLDYGIPYTVINPRDYGIDFYSDILFTTEAEVTAHPARVEALRRATLRGWRYALDHPDEIITLLKERYGIAKSRAHLEFEARAVRPLVDNGEVPLGHMEGARWEAMARSFADEGLVPPGYSLEGFTYPQRGEYVPRARDEELTAAVIEDFAPLYTRADNGEPAGFAIDVLRQVTARARLKTRFLVVNSLEEAIDAVRTGRADLVPGIGIDAERQREFLFSDPIQTVPVSLFVRAGDANLTRQADLQGHRVGVLGESVALARLRERVGERMVPYERVEDAVVALMRGGVDAVAVGAPVMNSVVRRLGLEGRFQPLGAPLLELKRGLMVSRSHRHLVPRLNEAIKDYISSPRYLVDFTAWYGEPTPYWSAVRIAWFMGGALLLGMVGMVLWRYLSVERLNRDLRRQKAETEAAKERAEAANRAKSEFLATMSHEIRTPMNGVLGFAELLGESPLDDEQRNYVETIERSAAALLAIIDDILDFSRLESRKLTLESVEFDPEALVDETLALFTSMARKKGLGLEVVIDRELPQRLISDPTRIRQMLVNLLGNALKFTERGEVRVRVACAADEAVGEVRSLELTVSDTGIGMDAQTRERLFEPFQQGDGSITRRYGGSGLGLVITRRIAGLMGGDVSVESEAGRGSVFKVSIPVACPLEETAAPAGLAGLRVALGGLPLPQERALRIRLARWGATVPETGGVDVMVIGDATFPVPAGTPSILWSSRMEEDSRAAEVIDPLGGAPVLRRRLAALCGAPAARLAGKGAPRLPGVRVLVVDDSEVNLLLAVTLLAKEGAVVGRAESAAQALEACAREGWDVILMDIQMPDMSGVEATVELRRRGVSTPVVAVTAHALPQQREWFLENGIDDCLSKPFSGEALVRMVESWLVSVAGSASRSAGPAAADGERPQGEAPPPAAVLDREWLLARVEGDEKLADELAALFLTQVEAMIGEIEAACGGGEHGRLYEPVHRLCGAAKAVGAGGIAAAAERMQSLLHAPAGEPDALANACAHLLAEGRRVLAR